jgi:hypothetical protein
MLCQDGELETAVLPPPLELLTQAYFLGSVELLGETTDIAKRIAATDKHCTRRPAKQNRRTHPQLQDRVRPPWYFLHAERAATTHAPPVFNRPYDIGKQSWV